MSEMEPETRQFLLKIASSLSVSLLWMLINASVGIAFGFAFFKDTPTWANILFYGWFIISLVWLLFYLKRKWDL